MLLFTTTIQSQTYVDYDRLGKIFFEGSPNSKSIKNLKDKIEHAGVENEAKELIIVNSKIKSLLPVKNIFRKCKHLLRSYNYYKKLAANTRKTISQDKRSIGRASTEYMKNLYITRYNNGRRHYEEYAAETNEYSKKFNSCNGSERSKLRILNKKGNRLLGIVRKAYAETHIPVKQRKARQNQEQYFEKKEKIKHPLINILFSPGRTSFRKGVTNQLDNLITTIVEFKDTRIILSGHSDSSDNLSVTDRMVLSEKRAIAIKQYLIYNGIDASRIITKGLGNKQPANRTNTEEGKAKNRRVEIKIK